MNEESVEGRVSRNEGTMTPETRNLNHCMLPGFGCQVSGFRLQTRHAVNGGSVSGECTHFDFAC